MINIIFNLYEFLGSDLPLMIAVVSYGMYSIFGAKVKRVNLGTYIIFTIMFYYVLFFAATFISFPDPMTPYYVNGIPFWYVLLCMIAAPMISTHIFLKGNIRSHFLIVLFYASFIQLYRLCCAPLYEKRLYGIHESSYIIGVSLASVLMILFLICLTFLFKKVNFPNTINTSHTRLNMIFYFPISILISSSLIGNNLSIEKYSGSIISFVFLTNIPLCYYFFSTIIQINAEKETLNSALMQTKAQLSRYRFSTELEDRLKQERHELRNRYFYIQTLLREKKYDEIDSYLEMTLGENLDTVSSVHTGNQLMDYILNKKLNEAVKYNIKTYTEILVPAQLSISDDALCTILLNLLDNAIEASKQESSPDIHITIKTVSNYLVCKIKNKTAKNILQDNPKLYSTKKNVDNHGQGIKIICNAVKKLNGMITFEMEDGYFVVTVMLPLLR